MNTKLKAAIFTLLTPIIVTAIILLIVLLIKTNIGKWVLMGISWALILWVYYTALYNLLQDYTVQKFQVGDTVLYRGYPRKIIAVYKTKLGLIKYEVKSITDTCIVYQNKLTVYEDNSNN